MAYIVGYCYRCSVLMFNPTTLKNEGGVDQVFCLVCERMQNFIEVAKLSNTYTTDSTQNI